ncbi:MAG: BglG family transcription antiterminator [Longicatena sp.]
MDKELIVLLQLLSNRSFVNAQELEEETKASKRQISYRMAKINNLLLKKKVPEIAFGYQRDIIISPETRKEIIFLLQQVETDKAYYFNKDERLSYIFITMFLYLDYVSLHDFITTLQVSRSTVLTDMKDLSIILDAYQIKIKNDRKYGYYLSGSEMKIRKYMMRNIIVNIAKDESKKVFDYVIEVNCLDNFGTLKKLVRQIADKHHISFVEDRLNEFIYIFIFLKARMISQKGNKVKIEKMPEMLAMNDMKEYKFSEALLKECKQGNLLEIEDIKYISAWILGISIGDIKEVTRDSSMISDIVKKILIRFESLSGFHYREYDDIFKQLYSHFRPAYYRLLFHLPVFNPLCERVKEEYKELYRLVSESAKPFVVCFCDEIPEDEIAYLTVHFAAIFSSEREGISLPKKRALVVCSNGIGSSAILYSELTNMFPDINFLLPIEVSMIERVQEPIDIIFTTSLVSEMRDVKVPVIKVRPVMSAKERYQLMREVYRQMGNAFLKQPSVEEIMSIVIKHGVINDENSLRDKLTSYFYQVENISGNSNDKGIHLCDMTNEHLIKLNINANSMEEAIRKSAQSLLDYDYVTQGYIDEMINVVKKSGAYIVITKHVALPHARPGAGAKKIGISISVLKEPVVFGNRDNDPVKYVFCLSAIDNESHISAMAELIDLLEKEDFYRILDQAKNSMDVMGYIKEYSVI